MPPVFLVPPVFVESLVVGVDVLPRLLSPIPLDIACKCCSDDEAIDPMRQLLCMIDRHNREPLLSSLSPPPAFLFPASSTIATLTLSASASPHTPTTTDSPNRTVAENIDPFPVDSGPTSATFPRVPSSLSTTVPYEFPFQTVPNDSSDHEGGPDGYDITVGLLTDHDVENH